MTTDWWWHLAAGAGLVALVWQSYVSLSMLVEYGDTDGPKGQLFNAFMLMLSVMGLLWIYVSWTTYR